MVINGLMQTNFTIFTDGAYSFTRDQGGIAFIIFKDNKSIFEYSKTYKGTTNNRMEMLACIVALESIQDPNDIILVSDSQYVVKTYTDNWKRKKNNDLWERFDKAIKRHKSVKFEWTKGHADNRINNRCDQLAVEASQKEVDYEK